MRYIDNYIFKLAKKKNLADRRKRENLIIHCGDCTVYIQYICDLYCTNSKNSFAHLRLVRFLPCSAGSNLSGTSIMTSRVNLFVLALFVGTCCVLAASAGGFTYQPSESSKCSKAAVRHSIKHSGINNGSTIV